MELRVNYKVLATERVGQVKVFVSDWEDKNVFDIKETLQKELYAPICDQRIFYQGRPLDKNFASLKNMYFRQGDNLDVQFVCEADLDEINKLLRDLRQFRLKICSNPDSLMEMTPKHFVNDFFPIDYTDVTHALELLAFRFFAPWKTAKSVTNRRFFVQEGGFDVFIDIFKFSFKRYSSRRLPEMNENGDPEERELDNQMLRFLNEEQINLLVACLTFLWNFSETKQDRKLIIQKGLFPLTLDALLFDPNMKYDFDPLNELGDMVVEVNEQAIGCVAGCIEFDADSQEEVVNNDRAIRKIFIMVDRDQDKIGRFSLFCSQLASNALFYCTFNPKTHKLFAELGYLQIMLGICKKYIEDPAGDMVLRYYCCLVLARVSSSLSYSIDKEFLKTIDELIDNFLQKTELDEMLGWEKRYYYVWMTLVPFVQLAFARGPNRQHDFDISNSSKPSLGHTPPKRKKGIKHQSEYDMEVEYDSVLTGEASKYLFNTERCSNDVEQQGKIKDKAGAISFETSVNNFDAAICTEKVAVGVVKQDLLETTPSNLLEEGTISTRSLTGEHPESSLYPGSPSVGRLGLFALSYLLNVEENCQLIKSEGMLGYLVCLSWYLPTEERKQLMEHLRRFPDSKSAPSLKIIARSVLASIHGLSTALEM